MDLKELIKLQKKFDQKHNWIPNSTKETIEYINKDLIGLFGEIGEFSNIVKKINLFHERNSNGKYNDKIQILINSLKEEVVDSFIYLTRLVSYLNIDLEKEYFEKLSKNELKYKEFETD
ncbi:nucleotide pyrophosphohydrolase [Candidatus Magnetomorum sp. HK-1]|nr:nucleotide pyrophosphohydrolase [Candidatus Magnetomorum sp. HK-1]